MNTFQTCFISFLIRFRRFCLSSILLQICFFSSYLLASVPKEGSLIRDAEIEDVLKSYIEPLFKAAKLNTNNLQLFIIHSNTVNAFAMAGSKIGVHTAFLLKAKSASQLIGVFAHETAHIADNHIIRGIDAFEKSLLQGLIGTISGLGAVFAGRPDAGMAILLGSQELAKSNFLKFSRTQEGSADQGAARILDSLGYSSQGIFEFLQILRNNDLLAEQYIDPYAITHPLTSERIDFFQTHLSRSPHANAQLPKEFEENFQRIQVKLAAFTLSPAKTFAAFKPTDSSLLARYGRSIAYLQNSQIDEALSQVNSLLRDYPQDAFFWDLKGQILFESGKIREAACAYERAVELRPDIPLLRTSFAHALLESGDQSQLDKVHGELLRAKTEESDNPLIYRLLAVYYGKKGEVGLAALSLAEMSLEIGDLKIAEEQAKRSIQLLKSKPTDLSRAKEVLQEVKRLKAQNSDFRFPI